MRKKVFSLVLIFIIILGSLCVSSVYAVSSKSTLNNTSTNTNTTSSVETNNATTNTNTSNNTNNNVSENDKENLVSTDQETSSTEVKSGLSNHDIGLLAAALATGLACIGAGIAVAMVASSAIGAISENPSLLGKTIIFAGLAEGIAIYGLIISIMILNKI